MRLSRGIMLGLISLTIFLFFRIFPASAEQLYGELFYPLYQYVRFYFLRGISFPLIYLLVIYIILWIVYKIFTTPSLKKWTWLSSLRVIFSAMGFVIFFFYILWGYNYLRPTMTQRLDINLETPDSSYIKKMLESTIDSLNYLRSEMDIKEGASICDIEVSSQIDSAGLATLRRYLSYLGYPNSYNGIVRELKPEGLLLRWSTAGFFLPFVGEAYIDAGLPNIQKPYVRMHELCHVYGVTQEGEANFLAFMACKGSEDLETRYSAYLSIYPYIASAARQLNEDFYVEQYARLDEDVKLDYKDISKCHDQFPSIMPKFRDFVYNSYLRTHGVEGGIQNYGQIIVLDYNWKKLQQGNRFLRGVE